MPNPTITIEKSPAGKFHVELDIDKFERLADILGLYNPDFLNTLDRSEKDYREGRYRKVKSLKELRSIYKLS
jgi:hypothetical protein